MIDRSVMVTLLTVLREQRDLACGTEEAALMSEINLRATSAIVTSTIREHLTMAEDKGWATWKRDAIGARRWRIAPAGTGALDDLKNGG